MVGLVLLGFTTAYREGFETVLFLQALVLDAGTLVVLQGVLVGLLAVAAIGYVTFSLQRKLPYMHMLIGTGILIGLVVLTMLAARLGQFKRLAGCLSALYMVLCHPTGQGCGLASIRPGRGLSPRLQLPCLSSAVTTWLRAKRSAS